MFRPLFAPLLCAALFAVTAGCSHYRLGTGSKLAFTTLYVEPVTTKILLPQAQAVIETKVRDSFLRDNRVTIVNSPDVADATLAIEITDYRREVATQRRDDTGLARKFALTLTVHCTLNDRRASKPLFSRREIMARRDAYNDSGQTLPSGSSVSGQLQAEYQALPLLADSLADKITHAVIDVW